MIWGWVKHKRQQWRHHRAHQLREEVKYRILMQDAEEFFAGKKTQNESLAYRDRMYRRIDAMSDDDILNWRKP